MAGATYDSIRSAILSEGSDSRVEVNQRALIDKILARYASANAVYRELLQNSNDAEATTAQILFTTAPTPNGTSFVTQVVYRNNGLPFRYQDWSRLRKIAEGNPDVSKVGAFGVGAYTMFSICEEPLVLSGGKALAFAWKGDALWVKLADIESQRDKWTTFVLLSRDPYSLPDLTEFGGFLCSSLTFTAHLNQIDVFVDDVRRMTIRKKNVHAPRIITPPKASSWWRDDGAVTTSPLKVFSLDRTDGSITETIVKVSAEVDGDLSTVHARYVSGTAIVRVPADMSRQMERVTKKKPPSQAKIEIFVDAESSKSSKQTRGPAVAITDAFSPRMGAGRVFIGFKTSQTTGLAVHLAAPLLPTVEREAVDFQNPTLNVYNCELLVVTGILMRLTLEHSMGLVGEHWVKGEPQRRAFEENERKNAKNINVEKGFKVAKPEESAPEIQRKTEPAASSIFSFARFMSSGVKKIADVISSVDFSRDEDDNLMHPRDVRPLSDEEKDAVLLMRSFSPQQSTPDERVGMLLAKGFEMCLPGLSPPVLTTSGVARGLNSRLPFRGIETFVKTNVVRAIILTNAESYLRNVAGCQNLSLNDLVAELRRYPIEEEDVVRLLKWWTKFVRTDQHAVASGLAVKQAVSFAPKIKSTGISEKTADVIVWLKDMHYYPDESTFANDLPMPGSVLPKSLREVLPARILRDSSLQAWFSPLSIEQWADHIALHSCLTEGRRDEEGIRLRVLSTLSREYSRLIGDAKSRLEKVLTQKLSNKRCIPCEGTPNTEKVTDFPGDLYLSSAELAIFDELGSFKKVSPSLSKAGVSDEFLVALGVRKTISMDFLFSQLDSLKWNRNPMPLISYLRNASLTTEDLQKLRTTQYLPEVNDKTRTYAPCELYLPNPELDAFPFVKVLQWPSPDTLHGRSPDAEFLKKLGCQIDPPLDLLMKYLVTDIADDHVRQRCLDFIYERLGPAGPYARSYTRFLNAKFLLATREDIIGPKQVQKELQSPNGCYSNTSCRCMGFAILDTSQSKRYGHRYAEVFRCAANPSTDRLVSQLLTLAATAKRTLMDAKKSSNTTFNARIFEAFSNIFKYMSSRSMDLDKRATDALSKASFIPCEEDGSITWYRPNQIYFESNNRNTSGVASYLFPATKFSPFLAAVGVKGEPSNEDLFRLLVSSPQTVLQKLGSEAKYRSLLRQVAANPPYSTITAEMRKSAFLLAYRETDKSRNEFGEVDPTSSTVTYILAKAEDICVIDNSHFSRLFNALSAPQESDLERFYISLGSAYISKKVDQKFFAIGGQRADSRLTESFRSRIRERRPLLSSHIISRPMVPKATLLLSDEKLEIFEVAKVKAIYTLSNVVRTEFVTCSAQNVGERKLSIFITQDLDWFHVGNALGSVILVRCNVQDAFFIGSLLEVPLDQLRARGFPVDRVLRTGEPIPLKSEQSQLQREKFETTANFNSPDTATSSAQTDKDGFVSILRQMFPECQEDHIRHLLGPNPSLESLRSVADQLADGNYPKHSKNHGDYSEPNNESNAISESDGPPSPQSTTAKLKSPSDRLTALAPPNDEKRRLGLMKDAAGNVINRAFRGLRGVPPAGNCETVGSNSGLTVGNQKSRVLRLNDASTSGHPDDTATQKGIEKVLRDSVKSARVARENGVYSPEHKVISVPESVERDAASCEVIPAHNLKSFSGPKRTSRTSTGLKVFSSRKNADNDAFLNLNWHIVESFATVLIRLCSIYSLRKETVSIFYESTGTTIAFNRSRALFFNLRYFANLHFKEGRTPAPACYAFWFTTIAHELSHNMESAHGKQHGFYTESYVSQYMPKLIELAFSDWRT